MSDQEEVQVELEQATSCPSGSGAYTIRAGDTLFLLAQRYGTTVAAITAANPGINPNALQVGQVICLPGLGGGVPSCPAGTLYTVRSGDTLYLIATRFGVTLQALLAANPGVDPNSLAIGQQICVPTGGAPVTRISTPCCVVLALASTAPPESTGNNPMGGLLIRQVAMSTRSLTFSAAGLPEPSAIGNYNEYLGTLAATGEPPANAITPRTAVMGAVTGAAGQPVTWAGTAIITELPAVNDIAEIRPFNSATGARGPAIFRAALTGCHR